MQHHFFPRASFLYFFVNFQLNSCSVLNFTRRVVHRIHFSFIFAELACYLFTMQVLSKHLNIFLDLLGTWIWLPRAEKSRKFVIKNWYNNRSAINLNLKFKGWSLGYDLFAVFPYYSVAPNLWNEKSLNKKYQYTKES